MPASTRSSVPDKRQIREYLTKILDSPVFATARRQQHLLRYLVDETLAGRADRLNQNSIAIDALGRDESFDPAVDSVVRVEAGRLRSKLREYYATAGVGDAVRLDLPKGKYAVEICAQGAPSPPATGTAAPGGGPAAAVRSIAVLPFVDMSPDKDDEYFGDALAEELINALGRLKHLQVAARTSAFSFKRQAKTVAEIAAILGVKWIVEGSVRKAGDRLRISAQLVDAADGYRLWSDVYERQLTDVFAIQEDIARAIVKALQAPLEIPPAERLTRTGTDNAAAYNLFLKGRHLWDWANPAKTQQAVNYFLQATQVDPDFADAYGYLAYAYGVSALWWSYDEVGPLAAKAIDTALALNPEQAEALGTKAFMVSFTEWDWAEAGRLYRRALTADPSSDLVKVHYGHSYLVPLNRLDEAKDLYEDMVKHEPYHAGLRSNLGRILLHRGSTDAAIEQLETALAIEPEHMWAMWHLCNAYEQAGDTDAFEQLLEEMETTFRSNNPYVMERRVVYHLQRGETQAANAALSRLQAAAGHDERRFLLCLAQSAYGDVDASIATLERMVQKHDPNTIWIPAKFAGQASITADARFQALLEKMNLDAGSLASLGPSDC